MPCPARESRSHQSPKPHHRLPDALLTLLAHNAGQCVRIPPNIARCRQGPGSPAASARIRHSSPSTPSKYGLRSLQCAVVQTAYAYDASPLAAIMSTTPAPRSRPPGFHDLRVMVLYGLRDLIASQQQNHNCSASQPGATISNFGTRIVGAPCPCIRGVGQMPAH
jgi:hypothetical protein